MRSKFGSKRARIACDAVLLLVAAATLGSGGCRAPRAVAPKADTPRSGSPSQDPAREEVRAPADAPERLASSIEAIGGRIAEGERVDLTNARLFVPVDAVPEAGPVPLSLHFQGGSVIAEENFVRSGRPGVLVASTLSGFSSAFSRPYSDPAAFLALLDEAALAVARTSGHAEPVVFDPITITFFSAGYGAVREFLKSPSCFEAIDHLVSVDSIYASVVAPDVRAPEAAQMADFMRFAQAAARGEKTFVLAYSAIETDYASTAECARLIFASVDRVTAPSEAYTERGIPIAEEVHVGGLHAYGFDEADAGIHIDCLYMVPEFVRRHVPPVAPR